MLLDLFPYHYGSHATRSAKNKALFLCISFHTTMVLTQRTDVSSESRDSRVSIPLWFSRNFRRRLWLRYVVLQVSIPLWFSRNEGFSKDGVFMFATVSIPLWFSRNHRPSAQAGKRYACFHTTMVLTQLTWREGRYEKAQAVSIPLWFSRNRMMKDSQTEKANFVSIPLWFSRNRFYYKDIIQVLGRQNQPTGKIP